MFKRILVAYDGSAGARKALEAAVDLARLAGASLALVSVEEYVPHFGGDVGEIKDEETRQRGAIDRIQREASEMV